MLLESAETQIRGAETGGRSFSALSHLYPNASLMIYGGRGSQRLGHRIPRQGGGGFKPRFVRTPAPTNHLVQKRKFILHPLRAVRMSVNVHNAKALTYKVRVSTAV